MTDSYQIGPISLTQAALIDNRGMDWNTTINNTVYQNAEIISIGLHDDGMETFQVYLTSKQLFQLKNLRKLSEPVWINLATDLDYYHMVPQGLYLLGNISETEYINSERRLVSISAKQLTNDKNDQLKYTYTPGINDQTVLESEYSTGDTIITYWDEAFSSWDTSTDWYTTRNYLNSSGTITAAGGYATFTSTASAINTWAQVGASSMRNPQKPAYFVFDLNVGSSPSTYSYAMSMSFMNGRLLTSGPMIDNTASFVQCSIMAYPTYNQIVVNKFIRGTYQTLYTENVSTSVTGCTFKVFIDKNNKLSVSRDVGSGYTEIITDHVTNIYYGNIWITPRFYNNETSSHTGTIGNILVYTVNKGTSAAYGNLISAPIGSSYLVTPDLTRASEDGNIPVYTTPTSELFYNVDMATNMYNGAVKVYNYHSDESKYYQVFGTDDKFTTSSFKASNGLIKLDLTSTGINFYYWNGSAYALLNTFTVGTINTIKVREINSERAVIQINYTYWVLQRGKKHVLVYHELTDLGYTKKDYYYHDNGLGVMAEENITGTSQDVEMTDWFYCNVYNTSGEDTYNLQIVKVYPQTIKNDNIPADEKTVIGWYHKGDTGYETSAKLALESHVWPDCNIAFTNP